MIFLLFIIFILLLYAIWKLESDQFSKKISQMGVISKDLIRIGDFEKQYESPDYAEQLSKGGHCENIVKNGKYGGSISLMDHVIYTCPRCQRKHELVFKHGDTVRCKCGLYSETYGNSLRVW